MIRDLYTVQFDEKQLARLIEDFVLRQADGTDIEGMSVDEKLVAHAEVPKGNVIVRVSVQRTRKPRDKASEAKQAGVRG